jgi:hypothetical protein
MAFLSSVDSAPNDSNVCLCSPMNQAEFITLKSPKNLSVDRHLPLITSPSSSAAVNQHIFARLIK